MASSSSPSSHKIGVNAEVIAIGSEMLFSDRTDSNSVYIGSQLERFGVPLIAKSIVGDDSKLIKQALAMALTRADFIFLTGGLGPTEDDLTRHAVSELLGLELRYRAEIVDQIQGRFRRLGRTMHEINKRQGFILDTATALDNPHGTAPGQYLRYEGRHVFLLPGPPRELQPMIQSHLLPLLARLGFSPWARRYFRISGVPESQVDATVAPIYRRYPEIRSTILASPGEIELIFIADEESPRLSELAAGISQALGDDIYTTEEISLEAMLVGRLQERGATLSVAESCTGGMLGEWITRVPGSSDVFQGGVIAYSNALKSQILSVSKKLLRSEGAVSAPVAKAMADGVRRRCGSDFGLSVTGIAGPGGGSEAKPVGTVFVGCSSATRKIARGFHFLGDREVIRLLSTRAALNLLRKELLRSSRGPRGPKD